MKPEVFICQHDAANREYLLTLNSPSFRDCAVLIIDRHLSTKSLHRVATCSVSDTQVAIAYELNDTQRNPLHYQMLRQRSIEYMRITQQIETLYYRIRDDARLVSASLTTTPTHDGEVWKRIAFTAIDGESQVSVLREYALSTNEWMPKGLVARNNELTFIL